MTTKESAYSGYRLLCEECGDKSASWAVDRGNYTDEELLNASIFAFTRQLNEITLPSHLGHKFKFKSLVINKESPLSDKVTE